jgi:DUF971 family protein
MVSQIERSGEHAFVIQWADGRKVRYLLSELQRRCPCANCVDENTGRRISDPARVPENLGATRLQSVGRYALRVDFKTGCSHGIFSFDDLYSWGEVVK